MQFFFSTQLFVLCVCCMYFDGWYNLFYCFTFGARKKKPLRACCICVSFFFHFHHLFFCSGSSFHEIKWINICNRARCRSTTPIDATGKQALFRLIYMLKCWIFFSAWITTFSPFIQMNDNEVCVFFTLFFSVSFLFLKYFQFLRYFLIRIKKNWNNNNNNVYLKFDL